MKTLSKTPAPTEFIAATLAAHDSNCIGCLAHRRDTMISFTRESDDAKVVYDLFLTEQQKSELLERLLVGTSRMDQINAWCNTFDALHIHLNSSYEAVKALPEAATGTMHAEATIKHAAKEIEGLRAEVARLKTELGSLEETHLDGAVPTAEDERALRRKLAVALKFSDGLTSYTVFDSRPFKHHINCLDLLSQSDSLDSLLTEQESRGKIEKQ